MHFHLEKYLGLWYEIARYPSWFERQDSYNTTAEYMLNEDGSITIHNSTLLEGSLVESYGTAVIAGQTVPFVDGTSSIAALAVSFPDIEVKNLETILSTTRHMHHKNEPNYLINFILTNEEGEYIYAVVSDRNRESLFVLSRFSQPDLVTYNIVMEYVRAYYDITKIIHVPHYAYYLVD